MIKKDSLTLSYFVDLRRILNRVSHSAQRAQWPLEFDCEIETRYTNISAPCVEEPRDAVTLLVLVTIAKLKTWAPCGLINIIYHLFLKRHYSSLQSPTGSTIKTTSALCKIEQLHCTCSVCHEDMKRCSKNSTRDWSQLDKLACSGLKHNLQYKISPVRLN